MRQVHLRIIAVIIAVLITNLPICLADQLNFTHDANGNLITGDGLYREYNDFNQLVRIRNGTTDSSPVLEEFIYHPTEERVLIKDVFNNSGEVQETTLYIRNNFVRVINRSGTFDSVYVKIDGQLVAQKNPDGSKYFIHNDHLGSASVITDQNGVAIENSSYSPFGEILSGASKSRFSYTGQEFDSVLKDFDYHARRYAAWLGQFIQPDTFLPNVYDPQQLNRYSYTIENPYKYTDPDGHIIPAILAVAVIAMILIDIVAIANEQRIFGEQLDKYLDHQDAETQDLDYSASEYDSEIQAVISSPPSTVKGAANPEVKRAIDYGNAKHAEFFDQMSKQGYITNKAIQGTNLRPDAIDLKNKVIIELKPDSPWGKVKAKDQLKSYKEAAEKAYGGTFETRLETYPSLKLKLPAAPATPKLLKPKPSSTKSRK